MRDQQLSFNLVTALGPNDPDDGVAGRQQRGMAIAALSPVVKNKLGYKVPSQSGSGCLRGQPRRRAVLHLPRLRETPAAV